MRIKKPQKPFQNAHPSVVQLAAALEHTPQHELASVLAPVSVWNWPRTDLQHWINVLNRFDTILESICADYIPADIQINEFTPQTKTLLVQLLRFTRLLLENSTNKKVFASSDRLDDLLLTRDLEILDLTLRLCLRHVQHYFDSARRPPISSARLFPLAQPLTPRDRSVDFLTLASDSSALPVHLSDVSFQYYNTSSAADSPKKIHEHHANTPARSSKAKGKSQGPQGLVTVNLEALCNDSRDPAIIVADALGPNSNVVVTDRLDFMQKVRFAKSVFNPEQRRRLLIIRLYALAVIVIHTSDDKSLQTKIFNYEPDLVAQLAQLIHPDCDVPVQLQAAALNALFSLCKLRHKAPDVWSAVNVGANHGVLLYLVRKTIHDLEHDLQRSDPNFVEALFSFLHYLQSAHTSGNMLITAGIVPLFVQVVDKTSPAQVATATRAVSYLDNAAYSFANASTAFINAGGVDVYVKRIKEVVDNAINAYTTSSKSVDFADNDAMDTDDHKTTPKEYPFYGMLPQPSFAFLKQLLRSVTRMMQTSGIADSLRNLIDSSLRTSIKQIMCHQDVFGPQTLALAINIMNVFIHNEPTTLSILQEAQVPDAFFDAVNEHISPSIELMSAIPHALGALSLNEAGLERVRNSNIIHRLITTLMSVPHARVLAEREHASNVGAAIDELMRHHPSLKPHIYDAIMEMMNRVEQVSKELDHTPYPTAEGKKLPEGYLVVVPPESDHATAADEANNTQQDDTAEKKEYDRGFIISKLLLALSRFLESVCQSSAHSKEFVNTHLSRYLDLLLLPTVPFDFTSGSAARSCASLLSLFCEYTSGPVLTVFIAKIREVLDQNRPMWETFDGEVRLRFLTIPTPETMDGAVQKFCWLKSVCNLLAFFENIFPKVPYSSGRNGSTGGNSATAALQTLNTEQGRMTLYDCAAVARSCVWETSKLKKTLDEINKKEGNEENKDDGALDKDKSESSSSTSRNNNDLFSSASHSAFLDGPPSSSSSDPNGKDEKKVIENPREHNATILKCLTSWISLAMSNLMSVVIGRPASRRIPDASHRKECITIAETMAQIMVRDLKGPTNVDVESQLDYGILIMSRVSDWISREKSSISTRTMVITAFEEAGGIEAILERYNVCRQVASENLGLKDRSQEQTLLCLQSCGGLRLCNMFLERLVSFKNFPEILAKRASDSGGEYSDRRPPEDVLVSMRLKIFPAVLNLWKEAWIKDAPPNVVRQTFRILVAVLHADGEAKTDWRSNNPGPGAGPGHSIFSTYGGGLRAGGVPGSAVISTGTTNAQPTVADESRIQQLADMGFPRGDASTALIRSGNEIGSAINYLLTNHMMGSASGGDGATQDSDTNQNANPTTTAEDPMSVLVETTGSGGDNATANDRTDTPTQASREDRSTEEVFLDLSDPNNLLHVAAASVASGLSPDGDQSTPIPVNSASATAGRDSPLSTSSVADHKRFDDNVKALDEHRSEALKGLFEHALSLTGTFSNLVFDIKSAIRLISARHSNFTSDCFDLLLSVIESRALVSSSESLPDEDGTMAELRLLALLGNDSVFLDVFKERLERTCSIVTSLSHVYANDPTREEVSKPTLVWVTPLLLVIETLLSCATAPKANNSDDAPKGEAVLENILEGPAMNEEKFKWLELSLDIISREKEKIDKNAILAALRVVMILTRQPEMSNLVLESGKLAQIVSICVNGTLGSSVNTDRSEFGEDYAILILRHIVESRAVLDYAIENDVVNELRRTPASTAALGGSVGHKSEMFCLSLKPDALRDPASFIKSCMKHAMLNDPDHPSSSSVVPQNKLGGDKKSEDNDNALATQQQQDQQQDVDMQADDQPPTSSTSANNNANSNNKRCSIAGVPGVGTSNVDHVVQFVMTEIIKYFLKIESYKPTPAPKTNESEQSTSAPSSSSTKAQPTQDDSSKSSDSSSSGTIYIKHHNELINNVLALQYYIMFLIELVYSYPACKTSFIEFNHRKESGHDSHRHHHHHVHGQKSKSYFLSFVVGDIIPFATMSTTARIAAEAMDAARIKEWCFQLMSVLSYHDPMSVQTTISPPTKDSNATKDYMPVQITSLRKCILEIISRAFKDVSSSISQDSVTTRHTRFATLCQLCNYLINMPLPANDRRSIHSYELPNHMAQAMLDADFPIMFTDALSEFDLNYPGVEKQINEVLRPLLSLAKLITKIGKGGHGNEKQSFTPGPLEYDPFDDEDNDEDDIIDDEDDDLDDSDDDQDVDDDDDDQDDGSEHDNRDDLFRNSALGMYQGELETGNADDYMSSSSAGYEEADEQDMEMDGLESAVSDFSSSDASMDDDDDGGEDIEQGSESDETEEPVEDDEDEEDEDHIHDQEDDGDVAAGIIIQDEDDGGTRDPLERMVNALAGVAGNAAGDEGALSYVLDEDGEDESVGDNDGDLDEGSDDSPHRHEMQELQDMAREFQNRSHTHTATHTGGHIDIESLFAAFLTQAGSRGGRISFRTAMNGTEAVARVDLNNSNTHPLLVDNANEVGRDFLWENGQRSRGAESSREHQSVFHHVFGSLTGDRGHWESIPSGAPITGGGTEPRSILGLTGAPSLTSSLSRSRPSSSNQSASDNNVTSLEEETAIRQEVITRRFFVPFPTSSRWEQEIHMTEDAISLERRIQTLSGHLARALIPNSLEIRKRHEAEKKERAKEANKKKTTTESKPDESTVQTASSQSAPNADIEMSGEDEEDFIITMDTLDHDDDDDDDEDDEGNEDNDSDDSNASQTMQDPNEEVPVVEVPAPQETTQQDIIRPNDTSESQVEESTAATGEGNHSSSGGQNDGRVTVSIHGRQVDITSTGIDPSFLEALPDDMREEVLEQHYQETGQSRPTDNSQTANSSINPDFLDALPLDLRAEVLAQERQQVESRRDRIREGREESRGHGGLEADPFSIFGFSSGGGGRRAFTARRGGRAHVFASRSPHHHHHHHHHHSQSNRREGPKEAVQILNKAGLAILVKLLFSPNPLNGSLLQNVLVHLSTNDPTRIELVTLLLGVLQKRRLPSLWNASSKPSTKVGAPPETPKKVIGPGLPAVGEPMPHVIAQRCLDMLVSIVTTDDRAPCWFFTEQETWRPDRGATATGSNRKGKAKEKQPTKVYPIVVLFELLENEDIVRSPSTLDVLTHLLSSISRVLPKMTEEKLAQEKEEESKEEENK